MESCHFRDLASEFAEFDAARVGISADPVDRQRQFDDKNELGFPLLSDEDHAVAEAFGVWARKSFVGRMGIVRSAFLIDEEGKVAGASYKIKPGDTVPFALQIAG